MKKNLLIAAAVMVVSVSSFGQGLFLFSGNTKTAWDNFTVPNVGKLGATIDVALLWAPSGSSAAITSIMASTPTNAAVVGTTYSAPAAWSAILNDPNFHFAVDGGTSANVQSTTTAGGAWTYNGSGSFSVNGTAGNTPYSVFVIGWSSAYATPALAAAANAPLGWSSVFSYTSGQLPSGPGAFPAGTPAQQFGVLQGTVGTVPEPATLALAGLGGASLLFFRRKK